MPTVIDESRSFAIDINLSPPNCVPLDYEIRGSFYYNILPKAVWDGAMVKLDPVEIIN